MSLVGPRPPIPYEVERYPAHWFARFQVKPGLTGLWQVSGRCELTLDQMIALDLEYVRRRSPPTQYLDPAANGARRAQSQGRIVEIARTLGNSQQRQRKGRS